MVCRRIVHEFCHSPAPPAPEWCPRPELNQDLTFRNLLIHSNSLRFNALIRSHLGTFCGTGQSILSPISVTHAKYRHRSGAPARN